jgi:soluble lytic murein transglycosylase
VRRAYSKFICFSALVYGCASSKSQGVGSVPSSAPAQSAQQTSAQQGESQAPAKGNKSDAKPEIVTSVTITIDQVSQELGVPKNRLEEQVVTLANFIDNKRVPDGLCDGDSDKSTEKLCSVIEDMQDDEKLVDYWNSDSARKVRIRVQQFKQQQAMGYGRLMRSLYRESPSHVFNWAPRMLEIDPCPHNLSAAALRKVENLLPSPSAKYMMEKLYEHASKCLKPDDEGYEITHLRQGLLRLQWGDKKGAREALDRAVLATDSSEKSRVLYWTGFVETDAKKKKTFWDKLVDEYPLSFHALEVWRQRNVDPYEIFSSRPALGLTRKVGGNNNDLDSAMRWLEALYIVGRTDSAQLFARWIVREFKEDLTPSNLLYISSLKSSRGTPLSTITFLTRQIAENPVILNQQTLHLLFPKPYFEVFDRASPNTDTFLVLSVARQESGFNPRARSPANARGLLQLLPSTARLLSGHRKNDLYDEEVNAKLGVKYLSRLIDRMGSVELALAAYNAGPGHIPEWKDRFVTHDDVLFMDLIPYRETRNYVANILRNNYWYERLYAGDPGIVAARATRKSQQQAQRSEIVMNLVTAHTAAPAADATGDAPETERGIASESSEPSR